MVENDFRAQFNTWVEQQKGSFINCFFELKFVNTTRKKSINVERDFKPHQLPTLHLIQHEGIVYTISNQSFGKKPFDSMKIQGDAFVVILFWKPRKPKVFYMVTIDNWYAMMDEIYPLLNVTESIISSYTQHIYTLP